MKRIPLHQSPDLAFFVGLRNGLLYSIPLWAIIACLFREDILAWFNNS